MEKKWMPKLDENKLKIKQKQEEKKVNDTPEFEYDVIEIRNGEEVK